MYADRKNREDRNTVLKKNDLLQKRMQYIIQYNFLSQKPLIDQYLKMLLMFLTHSKFYYSNNGFSA